MAASADTSACATTAIVPTTGPGSGFPSQGGLNISLSLASKLSIGNAEGSIDINAPAPIKKNRGRKKKVATPVSTQEKETAEKKKLMLEYLDNHPDQIIPVANDVLDGKYDPAKRAEMERLQQEDDKYWSEHYGKFQRLPDYYLRGEITKQNPAKLTDERLCAMQEEDEHCLWEMITFSTGLNKNWSWPQILKEKVVLDKVLEARVEIFGFRLSGDWPDQNIDENNRIIWDKGGAFRKKCNDAANPERVTDMEHCSGTVKHPIETTMIFLDTTETQQNYDDMKSKSEQGGFKPVWCKEGNFLKPLQTLRSQCNVAAFSHLATLVKNKEEFIKVEEKNKIAHHSAETSSTAVQPKKRPRGPPSRPPKTLCLTDGAAAVKDDKVEDGENGD